MDSDHRSCVRLVPLFAALTPQQQAAVGGYARPTRLRRGERLYGPGDPVSRLFVVHTGRVKVLRLAVNGAEQLMRIAGPGDVVGEHAFVTGERPDHLVVAAEDAQLCVFDHRDLAALMAAYPEVVLAMLRSVTRRMDALEQRLAGLSSTDVLGRLAGYLLSLPTVAGPVDDGRVRVRLPMARKDLASYLGTTPESLSRSLRRMADDRVLGIDRGPVVVIEDVAALERLAQPG